MKRFSVRLFSLLITALGLSLSPVLAAVNVGWQDIDVDKDGTTEKVAVTNLADIAFGPKGQIVGWYVKPVRATDYKGNYDNKPNLVKIAPDLSRPGTLSNFTPESSQFTRADETDPNADLIATFSQGKTQLTYNIHPQLLTIDLTVDTDQPRTLTWTGLGGSDRPTTKILLEGQGSPGVSGQGAARYIAWQTQPNAGNAVVLLPPRNIKSVLNVTNGAGIADLELPSGQSAIKVYGGFNELVRFHVEKLQELPGLFQPNIMGTVSLGLLWLLEFGFNISGSWGLALVILTLVITLATWPLRHTQYKGMAEMQKIQPLVEEINKKYSKKEDAQKKQEAMMKLYQEHKVNPLGGCLPLLIQMPVLFLLWKVISNYEFGQGFMWIPDLALPDPLFILPALYVVAIMASTWLSSKGNPQMMRQGMIMNLIFVWLVISFPAGVTFYYTLFTILSLGQQYLINQQLGVSNTPSRPAR